MTTNVGLENFNTASSTSQMEFRTMVTSSRFENFFALTT